MAQLFILLSFISMTAFSAVRPDLTVQLLTELPTNEIYEGHVFHDGLLWVGKSSTPQDPSHRVDVFQPDGKLVTSLALPQKPSHSATHMYPFGPHSVIVVGKHQWPWKTFYTVLNHAKGRVTLGKQYTFPEEIQIDEFAGDPGNLFFTEVGDAALFALTPTGIHWLKPKVSGVGRTLYLDGSLFVLERRDFALGDENIVKIDMHTETADRTFKEYLRQGLVSLEAFEPGKVVAAEQLANQVLVIDRKTNRLEATIPVAGRPRGLAQLGHCLVVSSEESRQVTFLDLKTSPATVVDTWDFSPVGDRLSNARRVAVDPASGRVFVRSTAYCGGCQTTQSSVAVARQTTGATFRRCQN